MTENKLVFLTASEIRFGRGKACEVAVAAKAFGAQQMGQPVGPGFELAIGDGLAGGWMDDGGAEVFDVIIKVIGSKFGWC